MTRATLISIQLIEGHIRGLFPFKIEFKYPISVIAGSNGSGKSTILALASCAFHNSPKGYKPAGRKYPYYTFSDFFIQTSEEIPPSGLKISYSILYNNWKKSKHLPDGIGLGRQIRKKSKGGKWNKYFSRVKRNVVFFGIERVVPHYEKSVSKSYRKSFSREEDEGWEKEVRNIVGRILNKRYKKFWYKKHSKYKLPVVESESCLYSGFNMGAGESALFDIFSSIYSCPEGMLVVIDEIELGLHEKAQKKFIEELKRLCLKRHIQIICTTHSPIIFKNIPPEGRFLIERYKESTVITPEVTSKYAVGKLAGENSNELDIYVEDGIASSLVEAVLTNETRQRVNILPIGSSSAIVRQLAARKKEIKKGECIAILDGDKYNQCKKLKKLFLKSLESYSDKNAMIHWFTRRVSFLPGETWPEKWLLLQFINGSSEIEEIFNITHEQFIEKIEEALESGKHNEIYTLAKELSLDKKYILNVLARNVAKINHLEFIEINDLLAEHLPNIT